MDNMSGTMEEKKDEKKQSDISIDELLQGSYFSVRQLHTVISVYTWMGLLISYRPSGH